MPPADPNRALYQRLRLAGPPGFEPGLTDPESVGLPLPHGPTVLDVTRKGGPGEGKGEATVNKTELVEEIAERTRLPAGEVAQVVEAFMEVVTRSLVRGDRVVLSGFGTFHRQARARRTARNIWADRPMRLPPTNVPAFRPGKPLKDAVARRRRRR